MLTCVGGCDDLMTEYLLGDDRNFSARWFEPGNIPPPSSNASYRSSGSSSFSHSNFGSSAPSTNFGGSGRGNRTTAPYETDGDSAGDHPNCECGVPAAQFTVKKDGPNKGRQFWTCANNKRCKYFEFVDGPSNTGGALFTAGSRFSAECYRWQSWWWRWWKRR